MPGDFTQDDFDEALRKGVVIQTDRSTWGYFATMTREGMYSPHEADIEADDAAAFIALVNDRHRAEEIRRHPAPNSDRLIRSLELTERGARHGFAVIELDLGGDFGFQVHLHDCWYVNPGDPFDCPAWGADLSVPDEVEAALADPPALSDALLRAGCGPHQHHPN